jgi:hypothetical protein
MISEECFKKEQEDENKPISQLLKEILEDLRNLRHRIVENSQMRGELLEISF